MMFVRSDCQQNVHKLQTVKVKTGVKGYAANKGAVSLRFNFDDTSFMLMNCHLTSGQSKIKQRIDDITQQYDNIMENFAEKEENLTQKLSGMLLSRRQDYQVLLGDMNFRCDLTCQDAKDLAAQNNVKALVNTDQLRKIHTKDPLLSRF